MVVAMNASPRKPISQMTQEELRSRFDEAVCRITELQHKHKTLLAEVQQLQEDIIVFGRILTPKEVA